MAERSLLIVAFAVFGGLGCIVEGRVPQCMLGGTNSSCEDALRRVFADSVVNCTAKFCSVEMMEGYHIITETGIFEDIDISLLGAGGGTSILCDSSENLLQISRSKNLLFQNLHFSNCSGPISVEQAEHLQIRNCSFRYFTEAVLDIFNCHHVNISDCVFEHNRGSGVSDAVNRGNTGCLAIGYKNLSASIGDSSVEITNSVFSGNIASMKALNGTSGVSLFSRRVYKGRGGGIGMYLDDTDVKIFISGCLFENNEALYGAGLYIALSGLPGQNHHKAHIQNCSFVMNSAKYSGGGVLATFRTYGDSSDPMIVEIIDSNFTRNNAGFVAGGVVITAGESRTDRGVQGRLVGCVFQGNRAGGFGSAARFTTNNLLLEGSAASEHEVINCDFFGNMGPYGILSVANVPLSISGRVLFENNTGSSFRVIRSLVTVDGDVRFVGNDVQRDGGGALHISSFGQILMKKNSRMTFENNTGSAGSAIVVDTQRISSTYSRLAFNPQCFLIYEDMTIAPINWTNISITFKGNSAEVGADIYANSLETCSWFGFNSPFFGLENFLTWGIFQCDSVLSIQTDQEVVSVKYKTGQQAVPFHAGYPTEIYPLVQDQLGKQTIGTLQLVDSSDGSVVIKSEPSVLVVSLNKSATVTFTLTAQQDEPSSTISDTLKVVDLVQRQLTLVNVTMNGCPPGQSLERLSSSASTYKCQCKNVELSHVIRCNNDGNTVILQLGYWSVYAGSTLHGYSCPPGYCRCNNATAFSNRACYPLYDITEPETQCVCGRQGILCGRCSNSSSGGLTSLYLHCEDRCHPAWWTIFPIAVVVEATIVSIIIFFNVKMPSWMIPILFYIRMASYYGYYFPPTFETVGRYMYFLSSLLSLYFPYDFCIPGANAIGVFAARFMPLFVAVVVWPIAWMLNKKWKGVYHWEGSVTLAFLLFSHVIHTALQILNCPMVYNTSNELTPRWYHDGEQKCFRGAHVPLGLLALAMLVAFIALCVLLAVTVSNKVKKRWMERLKMVLLEQFFRDKFAWWIIVEAAGRFSLVLILVIFPRLTIVPLVALALLLCIHGYCRPFRNSFTNYLQLFLLFALSLLVALAGNQLLLEDLFTLVNVSSDTAHVCPREELSGLTKLSLVLIPFYYLPVVMSAVATLYYVVCKKYLYWKKKDFKLTRSQKFSDKKIEANISEDHVTEVELIAHGEEDD